MQEETIEADREEDTDNIPREEAPNPETLTKPEEATTPPDTPVKAVDAVNTTRSPEAMKMAETTGSQEKTITRDKTNNTTKDSGRPWHCIMCKLSTTSPEPLAIHMISNHWEDSWTIRTENTPREFKLATKGTKN